MANTAIQIKFSEVTATPTSLNIAEPAYSYTSNTLFIGTPDSTGAIAIGGKSYVDSTTAAFAKANAANVLAQAAFAAANAASSTSIDTVARVTANAGFDKANTANVLAQAGFDKANTSNVTADAAFAKANTSNTTAEAAFSKANTANVIADASFTKANSANVLAQGSFDKANTANITAEAAFSKANVVNATADASFVKANAANVLAQASFDKANTSNTTADAAFSKANSSNVLAQLAFNQANTDVTSITATAGVYGNTTFVPVITLAANGRISSITNTAISGVSSVDSVARTTANAAFDKANTDVTSITATAGVYGNATFVPVITLTANGRISSITNTAIEVTPITITGGSF